MHSADYLLIINFALGLSFAAAFLTLSWRFRFPLGLWSAAGFVAASGTVAVEALASYIPSVKLTSFLSFSCLLAALSLICVGCFRHYRPSWPVWPIAVLFVAGALAHPTIIWQLPRDGIAHAFSYQLPFAVMSAIAALSAFLPQRKNSQKSDLALALVLAVSSAQFIGKAFLAHEISTGSGVRNYILSVYAHFSQTAAAVLSLLLGIALLVVVAGELLFRTRETLQRDALSGVWNRGAFFERISQALRMNSPGNTACVVLCDLDLFKTVNDRYGHAAGDKVIATFGQCLQAPANAENAICGRLGGEEFGVMLPSATVNSVRLYVEEVRSGIQRQIIEGVADPVTASFGMAFLAPGETLESALRRADAALYKAKADGRNTYVFAAAPVLEQPIAPEAARKT